MTHHEATLAYQDLLGRFSAALDAEQLRTPDFFQRLQSLTRVPTDRGALTELEQALIGIAVTGNPTSPYPGMLRSYAQKALAAGGTRDQILDALQLASVLGIHSLTVGIPAVADVLRSRGANPADQPLDAKQLALKADFEARRGYWHESWDDMLALDPEMFAAYLDYSSLPGERGALEPGLRELIYIAIDAVCTHLYVPGIQLHAVNALELGVSPEKIISALEIAALLAPLPYFDAIESLADLFAESDGLQ
jgi:alkylhydroperoxidase/carboxymuconolactone decarboxylase family protein YurZ